MVDHLLVVFGGYFFNHHYDDTWFFNTTSRQAVRSQLLLARVLTKKLKASANACFISLSAGRQTHRKTFKKGRRRARQTVGILESIPRASCKIKRSHLRLAALSPLSLSLFTVLEFFETLPVLLLFVHTQTRDLHVLSPHILPFRHRSQLACLTPAERCPFLFPFGQKCFRTLSAAKAELRFCAG